MGPVIGESRQLMAKAATKARKPGRKPAAKKTAARKTPARKTTARKTAVKSKAPAKRKTTAGKTAMKSKAPAKRKTTATRKKVAAKAAAPQPEIKRIRTAKGRRPYFFDDPNIDKLLAMLMALTGEVSVVRERLDTHERLAEKKKFASSANIERYKPTETVDQERVKWRADFVARILRIVTDELEQVKRKESDAQYEKIVEEVAR